MSWFLQAKKIITNSVFGLRWFWSKQHQNYCTKLANKNYRKNSWALATAKQTSTSVFIRPAHKRPWKNCQDLEGKNWRLEWICKQFFCWTESHANRNGPLIIEEQVCVEWYHTMCYEEQGNYQAEHQPHKCIANWVASVAKIKA